MRPPLIPAAVLGMALTVSVSACGGEVKGEAESSRSSGAPSSSPTSSSSPSPSPQTESGLSGTGGRILLAPADSPGTGRCSPAPQRGVVCSADGRTTYRFQPGAVRSLDVASASASEEDQVGWALHVTVAEKDRGTLTRLSRRAMSTGQLLLLLTPGDRTLISAPQVASPITGGSLQISGDLTEARARRFVRQVTSTEG